MGSKRGDFWLGAPFGRLGKALGFRWIMPIGTIPLPFHPWFARLLPWSILALVAWRLISISSGDDGAVGWRTLLIAATLLAIPLAIPIVQWLAMAFRFPLLQALLIGGAMVLLAADAAAGLVPSWAGAIPAAWLLLFAAQWLGGPAYLRWLRRRNAAFEAIEPGDRLVIVERDDISRHADQLYRDYGLARAAVGSVLPGRSNGVKLETYHRISPQDRPGIVERVERLLPSGWQVKDDRIVTPGVDAPGSVPPIRIRLRRHRAPLWLVGGRRVMLEVDDGARVHRLVGGKAALTGRWPLFTCFCYVNIFNGAGRVEGKWVAGFARTREEDVGTTRFAEMIACAFRKPSEDGELSYADAAPLHDALDKHEAATQAKAEAMLEQLLRLDAKLPYFWPSGADQQALATGHGPALCDCLAAAKAEKNEQAVRLAAQLIAALPAEEYRALSERLLAMLNSKELGFRILKDGVKPNTANAMLSRNIAGGYSLIRNVPRLYERLGELGEPARRLIMGLGKLGGWPEPLIRAREMLDGRQADS